VTVFLLINSMGNACTTSVEDAVEGTISWNALVEAVDGLASDSTSFSDTWIVHLREGVWHRGRPIQAVFAKVWMEPRSLLTLRSEIDCEWMETWRGESPRVTTATPLVDTGVLDFGESDCDHRVKSCMVSARNVQLSTLRMEYEVAFHQEVVQPLLEHNVCPNFVWFVASTTKTGTDLYTDMCLDEQSFVRSTLFMAGLNRVFATSGDRVQRPSVTDHVPTEEHASHRLCTTMLARRYRMLLCLPFAKGHLTLSDYLRQHLPATTESLEAELWSVLFQVLAACYALWLSGASHHDMHLTNIVLTTDGCPSVCTYAYADASHTFRLTRHVKIFDFDYSICGRLRRNPGSTRSFVHCSVDMFKVCQGVYRTLLEVPRYKHVAADLLRCITEDPRALEAMMAPANKMRMKKKMQHITQAKLMHTPARILGEVGTRLPTCQDGPGTVFVCRPNMFDKDGRLVDY
jgi:hypothetical protein